MLFGGALKAVGTAVKGEGDRLLSVDGWMKFKVKPAEVSLMIKVREELDALLPPRSLGEMAGDRGAAAHLQHGAFGSSADCGPPSHPSAVYPPFEPLWRQSTPPHSPGNTSLLGRRRLTLTLALALALALALTPIPNPSPNPDP